MIVAFGHKKQQGKDTAVGIIHTYNLSNRVFDTVVQPGSYVHSFAQSLYSTCFRMIPEFQLKAEYDKVPHLKEIPIPRIGKSPRQILIEVGQSIKKIIGADCFAIQLMHYIESRPDDIHLISDLRFPVEAETVKAAGGVCVKVTRPGTAYPDDEVDSALDGWGGWDYELVNDGTLADFEVAVIALYDRIRKEHSK